MFNYGFFSFDSKDELLAKSIEFWNPGKTKFWLDAGIDLVIDRREGYCLYDMSGKRLIDLQQWEGDKIFLRLLDLHVPFFSLKLVYDGDMLTDAVLNGERM